MSDLNNKISHVAYQVQSELQGLFLECKFIHLLFLIFSAYNLTKNQGRKGKKANASLVF